MGEGQRRSEKKSSESSFEDTSNEMFSTVVKVESELRISAIY